jgi:hypothetical protein
MAATYITDLQVVHFLLKIPSWVVWFPASSYNSAEKVRRILKIALPVAAPVVSEYCSVLPVF